MSIPSWSDEQLNELRNRADLLGDKLASDLYDPPNGFDNGASRLGYNHFLALTDRLEKSPDLMLAAGSVFLDEWEAMPQVFKEYFQPMELPAWVDPAKLEVASRMWMDDSLAMLVVLFLGSLPACYLMARGIPALYQTDKLANPRYISQRIYETGMMLDAVMDEGGFRILADVGVPPIQILCTALNELDPTGDWGKEGRSVRRRGTTPAIDIHPDALALRMEQVTARTKPRRFIGGPGYVTVKKVRLLHATMRYMFRNPERFRAPGPQKHPAMNLAQVIARRTDPWPEDRLGKPVNQEDLAYTLLTFGYLIPRGLEKWGWKYTPEQKHAFLHLWRLAGNVLGVEDELMTDDWDEAERIYERIQLHQAERSSDGIVLTNTLLDFVEDYLPTFLGLNRRLPAPAIRDLVGPVADKVLADPVLAAAKNPLNLLAWWIVRTLLQLFNLARRVLSTVPGLTGVFAEPLHHIAEEMIRSCRGAYRREPFFLPVDENTWVPQFGASEEFLAKLVKWRQRVFKWVFISVIPLMLGAIGTCATIAMLCLGVGKAWIVALISIACFVLALLSVHVVLPKVLAERPSIEDEPPIETPS